MKSRNHVLDFFVSPNHKHGLLCSAVFVIYQKVTFPFKCLNFKAMLSNCHHLATISLVVSLLVTGCEDTGSKKEYSILQELESDRRETTHQSEIEIIEARGYWCAGLVSTDRKQKVWIMLNAKYPPYYKQVDEKAPYWISERDIEKLKNEGVCSSTVLSVLQSRIAKAGSD